MSKLRKLISIWNLMMLSCLNLLLDQRVKDTNIEICYVILVALQKSGTVTQNCTYFEAPADASKGDQKTYQVSVPTDDDICRIRLDFDEFELSPPEGQIDGTYIKGTCVNDQFYVGGNTGVPVICGKNTGQHSKSNIQLIHLKLSKLFCIKRFIVMFI